MEKAGVGCFGPGFLEILRLYLAKNEIICHPLIKFLYADISTRKIFTPNILMSGTDILKSKYEIVN